MTQEDKDLLLKDLCARLPYGVKFLRESWNYEWDLELSVIEVLKDIDKDGYINNTKVYKVEDIKPYLRPMSSMTEEELKELKTLCSIYIPTDSPTIGFEDYGILVFTHHLTNNTYSFKLNIDIIDWLNAHHFDYRNLIERGLAIEVTEENNPYEN